MKKNKYEIKIKDVVHVLPRVTSILGALNKYALPMWAAKVAVEYLDEHVFMPLVKEYSGRADGIGLLEVTATDTLRTIDSLRDAYLAKAKAHHKVLSKEARGVGSMVHSWVAEFYKYKTSMDAFDPKEIAANNAVAGFLAWTKEYQVSCLVSEQVVFSLKYNYAGTLDLACYVKLPEWRFPRLVIIDIKTSNSIYPDAPMQVAAYDKAWTESREYLVHNGKPSKRFMEKIAGTAILRLDKETGNFQFKFYNRKQTALNFRKFKAFLDFYHLGH